MKGPDDDRRILLMTRRLLSHALALACTGLLIWPLQALAGELSEAVAAGDREKVRSLLKAGVPPDSRDYPYSSTPLELAISGPPEAGPYEQIALLLLKNGASWKDYRTARGETLLIKAVEANDIEVVKYMLARGANVHVRGYRNWTALSAAVGNRPMVEMLLKAGADVNELRGTPLWLAARAGDSAMIKLLIARGANANLRRADGDTALIDAASEGHADAVHTLLTHGSRPTRKDLSVALVRAAAAGSAPTVTALLEGGASPNAPADGGPPLFSARHEQVVAALVAGGANVNGRDSTGRTALMAVAELKWAGPVNELLARGADPNLRDQRGMTALASALLCGQKDIVDSIKAAGPRDRLDLVTAITFGDPDSVRALLDAGADPNQRWADGLTPLIQAARIGNAAMVTALVRHGADVHACQKSSDPYPQNWGPMNWAVCFDRIEAMRALLDAGAEIDERDHHGRTPLMHAVWTHNPETVHWLIEQGADVTRADDFGDTPVAYAAERGKSAIVPMLMARGVDISAANRTGATPLMRAAWSGDLASVTLFLDAGADPNARDSEGRTALMKIGPDRVDVAETLVRYGAVPGLKDRHGKTARDYALANRYDKLVAFFDSMPSIHSAPEPPKKASKRRPR